MGILRHPLFWISCATYFLLKLTRMGDWRLPFLHDYVADLVCMPVVMGLGLAFLRLVVVRDGRYCLPLRMVVITVVFYSLLFEVWFPRISTAFTADWWDVVAYSVGAVVFQVVLNRPEK